MSHFAKYLAVASLALAVLVPALALTPAAHAAQIGPKLIACNAGWVYDHVSRSGEVDFKIGYEFSNHNLSGSPAPVSFTSTLTGTVGVSVSTSVKLDANVIVAGVDLTAGVTVLEQVSYAQSTSITITVPPNEYGHGQYVMRRVKAIGHYYYLTNSCAIGTDYGYITSYSPYATGWNAWVSNT